MSEIITPTILASDKARIDGQIAASNKGAAIGSLYIMSQNVGVFIGQQGADLAAKDRFALCASVFQAAKQVEKLSGEMDEGDQYMWGEAMEHMQLSFAERCPQLLRNGSLDLTFNPEQQIDNGTAGLSPTSQPR